MHFEIYWPFCWKDLKVNIVVCFFVCELIISLQLHYKKTFLSARNVDFSHTSAEILSVHCTRSTAGGLSQRLPYVLT